MKLFGAVAVFLVLSLAVARADTVVGEFKYINNEGALIAGGGTVVFSLNGNGTIAATLQSDLAGEFWDFGFNSNGTQVLSGFTPFQPSFTGALFSPTLGSFDSAFGCGDYTSSPCGASVNWTISAPSGGPISEYTSVNQVLGGDFKAGVEFYLYSTEGIEWYAYAEPVVAAVPEASTWAMIIVGFGGLGLLARRRRHRLRAMSARLSPVIQAR